MRKFQVERQPMKGRWGEGEVKGEYLGRIIDANEVMLKKHRNRSVPRTMTRGILFDTQDP